MHACCSGARARLRRREAGEAEHACGRAAPGQLLHAARGVGRACLAALALRSPWAKPTQRAHC